MSATVRDGIGGTDAAAIIGMHPYSTRFDVFARIVHGAEQASDEAGAVRMEAGRYLEQFLMERYCKKHGLEMASIRRNVEMRDTKRPYLRGEADGVASDHIVECKTVWSWRQWERWGLTKTDDIPTEYLCQVAWYCWLADKPRAELTVLIDGEIREYTYTRDRDLETKLADAAEEFWNAHIIPQVAPPIFGAKDESVRAVYERSNGDMRQATAEEAKLVDCWQRLKEDAKGIAEQREHYEAQLKQSIGGMMGLHLPHGAITWKNNADTLKIDWEKIARQLGATAELIAQHSKTSAGARVLRFSQTKG